MAVKKLQWAEDWENCWVAEDYGGSDYYINASDPKKIFWMVDGYQRFYVSSVKEAKRAAQTHWENYVRSEFMEG